MTFYKRKMFCRYPAHAVLRAHIRSFISEIGRMKKITGYKMRVTCPTAHSVKITLV